MKRIFVGSSSEALHQAREIKEAVEVDPNCRADLWTAIFLEGLISIDAIEKQARTCCGAIFVFSPDDDGVLRGDAIKLTRANVQLEYGYFIALLGRERVLLCRYDDVTLPTDLAGMTVIRMGPYPAHPTVAVMSADVQRRITRWTMRLEESAHGCTQVQVHHGYSGRWQVTSNFTRWRSIDLRGNDFAQLTGYLDLSLRWDGTLGFGFLHGDFHVRVSGVRAHFRACDIVTDVRINKDATLHLTTEMFSREKVKLEGKIPQSDGFRNRPGSTRVTWHLKPDKNHECRFVGDYVAEEGMVERSRSTVVAKKM